MPKQISCCGCKTELTDVPGVWPSLEFLREREWIRLYSSDFYCSKCAPQALANAISDCASRLDSIEGNDD